MDFWLTPLEYFNAACHSYRDKFGTLIPTNLLKMAADGNRYQRIADGLIVAMNADQRLTCWYDFTLWVFGKLEEVPLSKARGMLDEIPSGIRDYENRFGFLVPSDIKKTARHHGRLDILESYLELAIETNTPINNWDALVPAIQGYQTLIWD